MIKFNKSSCGNIQVRQNVELKKNNSEIVDPEDSFGTSKKQRLLKRIQCESLRPSIFGLRLPAMAKILKSLAQSVVLRCGPGTRTFIGILRRVDPIRPISSEQQHDAPEESEVSLAVCLLLVSSVGVSMLFGGMNFSPSLSSWVSESRFAAGGVEMCLESGKVDKLDGQQENRTQV
ncbi:hypothetical protein B0H19DRAFT_1077139 [Mycena capillaripes]|nr:hypothetical protein B0H19DRAFT_1077139 [Mycena capillaripes]